MPKNRVQQETCQRGNDEYHDIVEGSVHVHFAILAHTDLVLDLLSEGQLLESIVIYY